MLPEQYFGFFIPGMAFDGDTPRKQSLGGSETTAIGIASELAKRGHSVKMFCNLPGEPRVVDRVDYRQAGLWQQFAVTVPHDFCVVQRLPEVLSIKTNAKALSAIFVCIMTASANSSHGDGRNYRAIWRVWWRMARAACCNYG